MDIMYRTLMGVAAAAMLAAVATPANAAAIRHAPGVQADQATVEHVWHRGVAHRRYNRPYRYRAYRNRAYRAYPYAYAPYPYYRRHYYQPRPYVQFGIGPFGLGVW